MPRQEEDVAAALAQRRQDQDDGTQAVHEVLAEQPRGHAPLEVHVGGAQHPHVRAADLRLPHPAVLLLLDEAEQLGLAPWRELRHLVHEERPALGPRHVSLARGDRAGEGPADVPEQLGLEQLVGQG